MSKVTGDWHIWFVPYHLACFALTALFFGVLQLINLKAVF